MFFLPPNSDNNHKGAPAVILGIYTATAIMMGSAFFFIAVLVGMMLWKGGEFWNRHPVALFLWVPILGVALSAGVAGYILRRGKKRLQPYWRHPAYWWTLAVHLLAVAAIGLLCWIIR